MEFGLELLLTYGPLGLWTAYLLWEKVKLLGRFNDHMEKNTEALHLLIQKIDQEIEIDKLARGKT